MHTLLVKLIAILLLGYAGYLVWVVVSSADLYGLIWVPVAVVTSIGLLLRKRWAPYLWHTIAFVAAATWLVEVAKNAESELPYDDALHSAVSLIPGLLLLAICAGGSFVIERYFRKMRT